jgi:hypothetical protein
MTTKVLKTWKYKAGYDVRYEEFSKDEYGTDEPFVMRSAYTPEGDYIGDPKMARFLVVKRGIKPEKSSPDRKVCSIGFSVEKNKWFGWSHRAIYGFQIGDVVKEGDCAASSGWIDEYLAEHPEEDLSLPIGFEAKTLEDTKRMAIAFAESVR